jgi:hypothetical protein
MERRLLLAAVVAALSDQKGEPMRPTEAAALIGERTLTGRVGDAMEYLRRHGVVEQVAVKGRVLGYRLTVDGTRFGNAAHQTMDAHTRAAHDVARGAVA